MKHGFVLPLPLLAILGMAPFSAWGCSSQSLTVSPGAMAYSGAQPPVGTRIDTVASDNVQVFDSRDCRRTANWFSATPSNLPIPGISFSTYGRSFPVYPTGVQGIGYAVGIAVKTSYAWGGTFEPLKLPKYQKYFGDDSRRWAIQAQVQMHFVVTGKLAPGTYTLPGRTLARLSATYDQAGWWPAQRSTYLTLASATLTVSVASCKVNSASTAIAVPLASTGMGRFTGAGTTQAPTSFAISLTCDRNVKVAYTLSGTTATNVSSVLANQAGTGMAKGVGVQLMQNDKPVEINKLSSTFTTTSTASQSVSIPFVARYYQTGQAVTPGKVSATATFTMNYQ